MFGVTVVKFTTFANSLAVSLHNSKEIKFNEYQIARAHNLSDRFQKILQAVSYDIHAHAYGSSQSVVTEQTMTNVKTV